MKEQKVVLQAREEGRSQGFEMGLKQGRMAFATEGPTNPELMEAEPRRSPRKSDPPPPPPDTSQPEAETAHALLEREMLKLHEVERDLD